MDTNMYTKPMEPDDEAVQGLLYETALVAILAVISLRAGKRRDLLLALDKIEDMVAKVRDASVECARLR